MYVKAKDGVVLQYPYQISDLKRENANVSFPNNVETQADILAAFDVYRVKQVARPAYNVMTSKLIEGEVSFVDGEWTQVWEVVALDADELAAQAATFKAEIVARVQERLDDFARTRNYDGILSAATYATSTVPKFATEGQYAVEARDATWAKLYQVMAEVEAGTRVPPTSYADIEPELPVLAWTN